MKAIPPPLHVLKFGGTSLATTASLCCVAEAARATARTSRLVIVVSAVGDITDRLAAALDAASIDECIESVDEHVASIAACHDARATEVLPASEADTYRALLHAQRQRLRTALWRWRRRPAPPLRDAVLAVGERLAAPLVAMLLRSRGLNAHAVDAATLVQTDAQHGHALVQHLPTYSRIRSWHGVLPADAVPVVTGFIGATPLGRTTTLGRGGSDYTAALLGAALDADLVERYTDVDGIYTADPRTDPSARRLHQLLLTDALRANRAGRLGMHARTLDPLLDAGVPLRVRSTCRPEALGTLLIPPARPLAHPLEAHAA